ncbi:MAG: hypothetical protein BYD32DRAFT_202228 [Podila humilis]|nr:MAG: hypothetical protein BYD32DRAFT_202228 [Podila humilis]
MNAVTKAFKTAKVAACKLSVPLVYNARVAGQVAKQVYIREGMAPPSGAQLEAAREAALGFVWKARRASTWKNISSDSYAKAALVAARPMRSSWSARSLVVATWLATTSRLPTMVTTTKALTREIERDTEKLDLLFFF